MSISIDTVTLEAMQLSEDQRLTLALRILSSVEPAVNEDAEFAWDATIRERIRRYDAGQSATIPASEVFKELDQRLAR